MSITVDISLGDFIDKMVILEIKENRIKDHEKLKNIKSELDVLRNIWNTSKYINMDIEMEITRLRNLNEILWEIEDKIREKELLKLFDEEFIELARRVYITNDKRASTKQIINEKLGSGLREEKSYTDYENETGRK